MQSSQRIPKDSVPNTNDRSLVGLQKSMSNNQVDSHRNKQSVDQKIQDMSSLVENSMSRKRL
jgi:hypothetical protein